ncbi:MAG: hypothetical protein IPJ65_41580 [Archangiaceae bacterium]|nr:hypothetical protein [Archangiaceae bacterium]
MRARVALLAALGFSASAAAEDGWETVIDGPPYVVKNRAREGTAVKEVWAEGDLSASVGDIQATLMDPGRFPKFMPNVKQSKEVGKPEADGSFYVYTELDLPVITSRDYVVQVWVDEPVKPDGSGQFRQHWKAAPEKVPEKSGLIRVKVNDGSWFITPLGDGAKSHVVYKFATDPGGMIPKMAVDMTNKRAVIDTLKAIESEAQRRAQERQKRAGGAPSGK